MKAYRCAYVAGAVAAAAACFIPDASAQVWSQYGDQTYGPRGTYSTYGNQTYGPSGTYSNYGNQTYGPSGTYSTYGNQTYGPRR